MPTDPANPETYSSDLLLGIDGGGSKTTVLVADAEGQVIGRCDAGGSNYQTVGLPQALATLDDAIDRALDAAGADRSRIGAVGLGLAGVDRAEDQRLFNEWLHHALPGIPAQIVNDAQLLLAAGTPDGYGVALICGTGANCVGRNQAGTMIRVDGWGHVLGDAGSGHFIGRRALQAVMRAFDGRLPSTQLTEMILGHWQLPSPEGLIPRIYQDEASPTEIAALARLVDAAATQGDAVALAILQEATGQLALSVATVVRRLKLEGAIPCALGGGVITRGQHIYDAFLAAIENEGITLAPVTKVFDPVHGALRLAAALC